MRQLFFPLELQILFLEARDFYTVNRKLALDMFVCS